MKNLWKAPEWMLNDTTFMVTGMTARYFHLLRRKSNALSRLLGSGTLTNLISDEIRYKNVKVYTCEEFLNDLKKNIWSELYTGKPIDFNRRGLQRTYVDLTFKSLSGGRRDRWPQHR